MIYRASNTFPTLPKISNDFHRSNSVAFPHLKLFDTKINEVWSTPIVPN